MEKKRAIALGFFDGVHLGHQALLKRAVERAEEQNMESAVFTFADSPRAYGVGGTSLTTCEQRVGLMKALFPLDAVITVPFDEKLKSMDWQAFLELLVEKYRAGWLVVGYDFRFGHDREGDAKRLAQWAEHHGIGCDIVEQVSVDGEGVHTTYIRSLLEQGRREEAERLLGYPLSRLSRSGEI